MKSYWGVDHGDVSKSYIPGKGWVSATKAGKDALREHSVMPRFERGKTVYDRGIGRWRDKSNHFDTSKNSRYGKREIILGRDFSGMRGRSTDDHRFVLQSNALRDAPGRMATNSDGHRVKVIENFDLDKNRSHGMTTAAAATLYGKNNRVMIMPGKAEGVTSHVLRHENAHLSPRNRTAYRSHQITNDGAKVAREEARAEMVAGRPYTKAFLTKDESVYNRAARDQATAERVRLSHGFSFTGNNASADAFRSKNMAEYRRVQDRMGAQKHKNLAYRLMPRNEL